uniref:Uncharacterized protein n=1 Tax=Panagrolaimus sp. ES5 TaxID=591445 RepID=A0AC34F224_9BILA
MLYAEDDYDLYLSPRVAEYSPVKGGTSRHLMVIRDPGKPKVDKLIIIYKKTTCKSAIEAFVSTNDENTEVKKALIALVSIKHHGMQQPNSKHGSQISNEVDDDNKKPIPNGASNNLKVKENKKEVKKSKK